MPKERKATHQTFEGRNPRGAFVKLTVDMMESQAWETLPMRARALYMEFKKRYKQHSVRGIVDYSNKDDISMPVSRWKPLYDGYQKGFEDDRDELIERGFITMMCYGHVRKPNIYALSDKWQTWTPPKAPPAKKARASGSETDRADPTPHSVYYATRVRKGTGRSSDGTSGSATE